MRLSVVFELLLVFLFLAFAAARVIDPAKGTQNVAKGNKKTTTVRQGPPNRYCACTSRMCNCCRDFSLPVVPIKGPGCASIMYVQRDTMMVTMSFGDRVLSNTTISGKTPKPICMALPGGISQFCGRVYGISRKGEQFRACLGLELRALDDIEAALRVSCFKFGPKGVKLESAPPVPAETGGKDPEEDDEDDYDLEDEEDDDLIGFGVDDEDASSEDNEVDSDSVDYTGFSVLGEDILGTLFSDDSGSSAKKKKPNKKTAKPQVLVPQVVVPKVSTTARPILPNRRRSTAKPLSVVTARPLSSVTSRPLSSVTSRPLINRVTKRPALNSRPQIIKRPSVPVVVSSQLPVTSTIVTKDDVQQSIITKSPVTATTTTETPPTTVRVITTMQNEKLHTTEEEMSQETTATTEEPITFTIPTQRTEIKNEIKLTQTDLDKLEAVAAIAQQDVTSGVISSSLSSEEAKKPMEIVTVNYEKIRPTSEKLTSIKFVPTTVVTSRPSAEVADSLEQAVQTEIANSEQIKNKIIIHQQPTVLTQTNKVEHIMLDSSNTPTKKGNYTISVKKRPTKKPVKPQYEQEYEPEPEYEQYEPEQDEPEEEEEEEEEDEDDGPTGILEGVLGDSDDDDTDVEEVEEEEDDDNSPSESNRYEEEEEEEEEEAELQTSHRPTKVKKRPASDDEEEEEEDILDVLSDDDEEESDDEEEEEEPPKPQKQKKKKKKPTTAATTVKVKRPATQATTIKVRKPTTQQVVQTRKPVTTTEKLLPSTTTTEKLPEKVFIYTQPASTATEKVIIYQEPESNKLPDKVFIYKQPEPQMQSTEKVIFYQEPETTTSIETYNMHHKEPDTTENPQEHHSSEEKDDSEEEEEKEDSSSSEEEQEESTEPGKIVASIVKPGFSNKYAEEHDLTESDDLGIEDPEDDFEEDRKMKENVKKPVVKSSLEKKTQDEVSKSKILTLSDLIGQRKKFYDHSKDDKPISTSRTHRRMNLDRLLQA